MDPITQAFQFSGRLFGSKATGGAGLPLPSISSPSTATGGTISAPVTFGNASTGDANSLVYIAGALVLGVVLWRLL